MALEVISIILQGAVVTGIGLAVYQTGYRWFKGVGSTDFQSKESGQIILIGFLFGTGYISEPLLEAIKFNLTSFTTLQQLGIVIIVTRVLVNLMVTNWNSDDTKSLYVYGIGAILILWPSMAG